MSDYMNSDEDRKLFETFYTEHHERFGDSASILHDAIVTMSSNHDWASRRLDGLGKYLKTRNSAGSSQITTPTMLLLTLALSLLRFLFS